MKKIFKCWLFICIIFLLSQNSILSLRNTNKNLKPITELKAEENIIQNSTKTQKYSLNQITTSIISEIIEGSFMTIILLMKQSHFISISLGAFLAKILLGQNSLLNDQINSLQNIHYIYYLTIISFILYSMSLFFQLLKQHPNRTKKNWEELNKEETNNKATSQIMTAIYLITLSVISSKIHLSASSANEFISNNFKSVLFVYAYECAIKFTVVLITFVFSFILNKMFPKICLKLISAVWFLLVGMNILISLK